MHARVARRTSGIAEERRLLSKAAPMSKRILLPLLALVAIFAGSGCYASAGYSSPGYYRTYPSGYYYTTTYPAYGYYGPRYYGPRSYGPRYYPEVQRYRPYVHQAPPAYRAPVAPPVYRAPMAAPPAFRAPMAAPPVHRAPMPAVPYVAPRAR